MNDISLARGELVVPKDVCLLLHVKRKLYKQYLRATLPRKRMLCAKFTRQTCFTLVSRHWISSKKPHCVCAVKRFQGLLLCRSHSWLQQIQYMTLRETQCGLMAWKIMSCPRIGGGGGCSPSVSHLFSRSSYHESATVAVGEATHLHLYEIY